MKLQHTIAAIGLLFTAVMYVQAAPRPTDNQELDMLQIPLSNGKELDVLTLGSKDQEQLIADRNKRTIGLLRELFPDITKEIDSIVNRIIAQVIRVAGPSLLPALLGNNRGGGAGGGGGGSVSATFDADFDDDDDDDDDDDTNSINLTGGTINSNNKDSKTTTTTTTASPTKTNDVGTNLLTSNQDPTSFLTRINIDLPTFEPPTTTTTEVNKVSDFTRTTTTTEGVTFPTTTTTTTSTNPTTTTQTQTEPPSTTINYIASALPTQKTTSTETPTTTTTTTTTTTLPPPPTTTLPSSTLTPYNASSADATFPNLNDIFNVPINDLTPSPADNFAGVNDDDLATIIDNLNRALNFTNYFINGDASDTQIDLSAINKQLEETIRVARQVKEAEAALLQQQQQPQQLPIPQPKHEETIQLSFNNEVTNNNNNNDDSKQAASISNELHLSDSKSPAIDELTLDSAEDTADLDDRNKSNLFKRFLSFGGGAGLAGGSSGGSGGSAGASAGAGGSGNFLFDIVRLFSGSVQTQTGDEAANSVSGGDSSGDSDATRAADGYTEAIPGPVTRLVVLANRGLANLIQDLILRVAATSEKFVNFKAKLITALI